MIDILKFIILNINNIISTTNYNFLINLNINDIINNFNNYF